MQERTDKRAWKELKTNDVMLIVQVLNVTMKQNCIPKRIFSVQTVLATSPRRLCRFSTLDYKVTRHEKPIETTAKCEFHEFRSGRSDLFSPRSAQASDKFATGPARYKNRTKDFLESLL